MPMPTMTRAARVIWNGHLGQAEEADVSASVLGFVHDQKKENQR
ncbi:hypothetical protein [Streptomyces olivaceoviridis]